MPEPTHPSPATRDAESREADAPHVPGDPPTPEEEAAAAEHAELDPGVAASESEMNRRGADQKGEGRID
jgi:hypothetical protein